MPTIDQILYFNTRPIAPLDILPYFHITLGGKIFSIDVIVVQGTLYFNMLLRQDYFYAMEVLVSTLFQVMHFPHDGKIVIIYHLSFVNPDHQITTSHQNCMNVPHVLVVPFLVHVSRILTS